MIFNEINLNNKDKPYLLFITIITSILAIYYMNFSLNLGIFCSDIYVYLVNGLAYSGHNVGGTSSLWLSPFICFLVSLFFDLGFKNELSILIISSVFAIIGNIGLYYLMRFKFNQLLSCLGVIIYATFSATLIWFANGTLDIPGVAMNIWFVIFALVAIDKNPKYYIPTILIFLLGFFTRYTIILMLPIVLLYFIYKKKYKPDKYELKYILISLGIAIFVVCAGIAVISVINQGKVGFLRLGLTLLGGNPGGSHDAARNTNLFHYAYNFFNYLSSSKVVFIKSNPDLQNPTILSYIYGLIIAIGAVFSIKDNLKTETSKKYLALSIVLIIASCISFVSLSSTITMIILFITFIAIRKAFKTDKFDFNFMMISWVFINFVFYSYLNFKVNRYFITILPVVSYFIVYGISKIQEKVKINEKIIPLALIAILIVSAFAFTGAYEQTDDFKESQKVADYIINENPDYQNDTIGSYNIRPYIWHFNMHIDAYKSGDPEKIDSSNITYYISNKNLDLENYTIEKQIGSTYIYKINT